MLSSAKSFDDLLKLVQNTNDKYKKYLTTANKHKQSILTKDEIEKEIYQCQKKYDATVSNNIKIVTQKNNISSLNYNINQIKRIVENKFVQVKTAKYKDDTIQKFAHNKFSPYSICQFDLKYTKLTVKSTVDCDNKHIKIGSTNGECYGMILSEKKNQRSDIRVVNIVLECIIKIH